MRSKISVAVAVVFILALLGSMLPGCTRTAEAVESYVAVVPRVLQSGGQEAVSLALFGEEGLTSGRVEVALLCDGQEVLRVEGGIDGKGTIQFDVPDVEEGEYTIRIRGQGFEDQAEVRF
jgi:hypothetical protein